MIIIAMDHFKTSAAPFFRRRFFFFFRAICYSVFNPSMSGKCRFDTHSILYKFFFIVRLLPHINNYTHTTRNLQLYPVDSLPDIMAQLSFV